MRDVSLAVWLGMKPLQGARVSELLSEFGSLQGIYAADAGDYRRIDGITDRELKELCDKDLKAAKAVIAECEDKNISVLGIEDDEYPDRLRNIIDPPPALYVRGDVSVLRDDVLIAMIGTRTPSEKGKFICEKLSRDLSSMGVVIVSGMARGLDSSAHFGALDAGGRTVAVLGCGADVVYPPENYKLMSNIIENGAVITEYPPGSRPLRDHFPRRNRIISGISLGVCVVEAPYKSGSLITASHALEQGRDVFAVPGDIDKRLSAGCNYMIKNGAAKLVMSASDIADEYRWLYPDRFSPSDEAKEDKKENVKAASGATLIKSDPEKYAFLEEDERTVFSLLSDKPKLMDLIVQETGFEVARVGSALTVLEMYGLCRRLPGQYFKIELEV